ncbi:MAG: ABC transporter permease [Anaerolineae bacterium]
MFKSVFLKTLYDMRRGLLWWSLGMFVLCLYLMTLFPALDVPALSSYLETLPESITVIMGGVTDFSTWESYLAAEMYGLMFPGLTVAFALAFGAALISDEEDSGTLDLLLANPIPRWRVLLEKLAALVLFTLVVLVVSFLGYWAGAALADVAIEPARLWWGTFNLLPLTLFFGVLALMLTALRRGRGVAVGVSAGLAVITYFIEGLALVSDMPEWLTKLSPWHYYDGAQALVEGVDPANMALLTGAAVIMLAVALGGFQRRDLGV